MKKGSDKNLIGADLTARRASPFWAGALQGSTDDKRAFFHPPHPAHSGPPVGRHSDTLSMHIKGGSS